MNRRLIASAMVLSASLLSSQAVYAAPFAAGTFSHTAVSKTKPVSFNMRNDSKLEMKVQIGDNLITLQPGKAIPVKFAVGEKIVAVDTTANYPAGTVLTVVSSQLNDATVVLR